MNEKAEENASGGSSSKSSNDCHAADQQTIRRQRSAAAKRAVRLKWALSPKLAVIAARLSGIRAFQPAQPCERQRLLGRSPGFSGQVIGQLTSASGAGATSRGENRSYCSSGKSVEHWRFSGRGAPQS